MTKPQLGSLSNFNGSNCNVLSETMNFDANLFRIALPLTTVSGATANLTFLPKKRIIIISGIFKGNSDSDLAAFITEIDNQVDNATQSIKTYISRFNKSYSVRINSFTYTATQNTPNNLEWTLELWHQST
jgi:hypothetical protein